MSGSHLDSQVQSTQTLLQPLLTAFVGQENSWWFTAGIASESGSSNWGALAQQYMGEPLPEGWSFSSSTNAFHLLSDETKIPPYYREKHRANVTVRNSGGKTLESSTVTQLRYVEITVTQSGIGLNGYEIIKEEKCNILNELDDTGAGFNSAIEIANKMVSRQLIFNRTDTPSPESLDDGNRCAAINERSYQWALDNVSPAALARFKSSGIPMNFVADIKPFPPGGPWWIWNYMKYSYNSGTGAMDVASYYAFIPLSGLAYGAGNHYCKLLSPARAMEWIYTASLIKPQ
jgi:hypothetical protein